MAGKKQLSVQWSVRFCIGLRGVCSLTLSGSCEFETSSVLGQPVVCELFAVLDVATGNPGDNTNITVPSHQHRQKPSSLPSSVWSHRLPRLPGSGLWALTLPDSSPSDKTYWKQLRNCVLEITGKIYAFFFFSLSF